MKENITKILDSLNDDMDGLILIASDSEHVSCSIEGMGSKLVSMLVNIMKQNPSFQKLLKQALIYNDLSKSLN